MSPFYHLHTPKVMDIGPGKKLSATGVIKKVFLHKPDPYGFLLLLSPLELRGQEASFFSCDIKVPQEERNHLRVGMQLDFKVIDKPADNMKSSVDYKAIELEPLTPAYYQGVVVRAPDANKKFMRVAIDLTLEPVKITPASYLSLNLEKDLVQGDTCVVQLTWQEMIDATKAGRPLEGDIVSACRLRIPTGISEQETETASEGTETASERTDTERTVASEEDSSSEQERHRVKYTPKKVRQPLIRAKAPIETMTKPPDAFGSDCRFDNAAPLDPPSCSASCCQDPRFPASIMQPNAPCPIQFQPMHIPCPCAACAGMHQTYPMIPPCCLSSYAVNFGPQIWSNMNDY